MNLTQNDRLKQVTSDTLMLEQTLDHKLTSAGHLTGEGLSFQEEYLSLATLEWDSILFSGGQRNS